MNNNTTVKTGLGFWNALQLALIIMKLAGIIKWSWWAVLIPLWCDVAVVLAIIVYFVVMITARDKEE